MSLVRIKAIAKGSGGKGNPVGILKRRLYFVLFLVPIQATTAHFDICSRADYTYKVQATGIVRAAPQPDSLSATKRIEVQTMLEPTQCFVMLFRLLFVQFLRARYIHLCVSILSMIIHDPSIIDSLLIVTAIRENGFR